MPLKLKNSLIFIFFIFLAGCTTIYNSATEKQEFLLIDTAQEVSLGSKIDQETQKQIKLLQDSAIKARIEKIGQRIKEASDRSDLTYHFRIAKDKDFNAFALPGGFIYLNSGLIEATNEDELACVIGHEIGHIAARHSVKKMQSVMGYQIIASIALGMSGKKAVGDALDIVFNLVSLGYSRQDELLADKLAVKYAKKAGFNPYAMITFFEKLKKEAQGKGPNFNLVFLSSHPPIEERIKNVSDILRGSK